MQIGDYSGNITEIIGGILYQSGNFSENITGVIVYNSVSTRKGTEGVH
jgi:hypothetical protein